MLWFGMVLLQVPRLRKDRSQGFNRYARTRKTAEKYCRTQSGGDKAPRAPLTQDECLHGSEIHREEKGERRKEEKREREERGMESGYEALRCVGEDNERVVKDAQYLDRHIHEMRVIASHYRIARMSDRADKRRCKLLFDMDEGGETEAAERTSNDKNR